MKGLVRIVRDHRADLVRFAGIVLLLIVCHALLRHLAVFALGMLALFAPVAFLVSTDRFRGAPSPDQFANFFAAVGVAGALLFLPVIAIICAAALLALGIAWLGARHALTALTYERRFTTTRVFPGDETELEVRIANRKVLPLGWFRFADPIHVRGGSGKHHLKRLLNVSGTLELVEQQTSALVNVGALGPFQMLTRRFRVEALHRGVYAFGPAEVTSGDPFGLFTRHGTLGGTAELIVYPRVLRPDDVSPTFWASLGTLMTRRTLFEDPTMPAGSREYRPDDPLNRVHWKSTARTGDLHVRLHDPSTTTRVMVLLNVHTFTHAWQGVEPERMEAAIETAASLATAMLRRGFAVGLCSNGVISDVDRSGRVEPSASPQQAGILLEHLARLQYSAGYAAASMLRDEAERRDARTSIVFVTPLLTPDSIEALRSASLANRISVVYCGRFAAPVVPGVTMHLAVPSMKVRDVAS